MVGCCPSKRADGAAALHGARGLGGRATKRAPPDCAPPRPKAPAAPHPWREGRRGERQKRGGVPGGIGRHHLRHQSPFKRIIVKASKGRRGPGGKSRWCAKAKGSAVGRSSSAPSHQHGDIVSGCVVCVVHCGVLCCIVYKCVCRTVPPASHESEARMRSKRGFKGRRGGSPQREAKGEANSGKAGQG